MPLSDVIRVVGELESGRLAVQDDDTVTLTGAGEKTAHSLS